MSSRARVFLRVFGALATLTIVALLISRGYHQSWTGFPAYMSKGELVPSKKLWDWMSLLVVPLGLAIAAFYLNKRQKESELQKTVNQQQEASLQAFITQMSELLLTHNLLNSQLQDGVRTIARARALTVLKELDGKRKGLMIRFLVESRLLQREGTFEEQLNRPIVSLDGADLRGADLSRMNLSKVAFEGVDLTGANLEFSSVKEAEKDQHTRIDHKWELVWNLHRIIHRPSRHALRGQDLSNADLTEVNLSGFDLRGTDLRGAILNRAWLFDTETDGKTRLDPKWELIWKLVNHKLSPPIKFSELDLAESDLTGHTLNQQDLSGCRLNDAVLTRADLREAKLTGISAISTNFEKAELAGADLTNASLALASFHQADLSSACMRKADLTWTKFTEAKLLNANLTEADLTYANLCGADLAGANLMNARFRDTEFDRDTKWPAGFDATTTPGLKAAGLLNEPSITPETLTAMQIELLNIPY